MIAAIGASSGGLDVTCDIIAALSELAPGALAVIVAQHTTSPHSAPLVEMLAEHSRWPVALAQEGEPLVAGHIYVTPPSADLEVVDGRIRLAPPSADIGPRPRIDRLFRSLARGSAARCIGVVLSGSGSDGTAGLAALRLAGGITIVQQPATCRHDGMPRAAIDAGAVDRILPPADIAPLIAQLALRTSGGAERSAPAAEPLGRILERVAAQTGVDLSPYRGSSLDQRLARRMSLALADDPAAYLRLLDQDPLESAALVQEVLGGATAFFRDPQALVALERLIEDAIDALPAAAPFRAWIPGCASGEEAYTAAIQLAEICRAKNRSLDWRIFATDLAKRPLDFARRGIYTSEALGAMPPELLSRYFQRVDGGHQVERTLRERVIFSLHDLTRDAPFSRLDLISCRNVMICFRPELQQAVFETFHYALNRDGLLMLGSAEDAQQAHRLFQPLDEHARIYRKDPQQPEQRPNRAAAARAMARAREARQGKPMEDVETRMLRLLASEFGPGAVVVNARDEVIHVHGDISPLCGLRAGPGSLDLIALAHEPLRGGLRALLQRLRRRSTDVGDSAADGDASPRLLSFTAEHHAIERLRISAMRFDEARPGWLLISFTAVGVLPARTQAGLDGESARAELERELEETRSDLHAVIEELESANQELQSANEDLLSANDDFQSANERLQTANEELRSTNEALLSLNGELHSKTEALIALNSDLKNVLDSIAAPLIVVDEAARVWRSSASARELLLGVDELRTGESLYALPWRTEIPGLRDTVGTVLATGAPSVCAVQIAGVPYQLQVSPCHDPQRQASGSGAVLLFSNVAEFADAQRELQRTQESLQTTLGSITDGVLRFDRSNRLEYMNPAMRRMLLELLRSDAPQDIQRLSFQTPDYLLAVDELCALAARSKQPLDLGSAALLIDDEASGKVVDVTAISLHPDRQNAQGVVVAIRDVTDRARAEAQILWAGTHDELTGLVNRREFGARLKAAHEAAKRGEKIALLYLDLDQFKVVNDQAGHIAGDELLRQVSQLLNSQLRPDDTLARMGGDEFCAILRSCSLEEAVDVAERVRHSMEGYSFGWENQFHRVRCSIGLAPVDASESTDRVLAEADAACRVAKEHGRNNIKVSSHERREAAVLLQESDWVARLLNAIANNEVITVFEPFGVLGEPASSRAELLVRLRGADGGVVPPSAFIPAAERYGAIPELDRWVLARGLEALRRMPQLGRLHINISRVSIAQDEFLDDVREALAKAPAEAARLAFELTETTAFSALTRTLMFSELVRSFSAELFLDDFGSGSSALSSLRSIPLDGLKIEGTFVRGLEQNEVESIIVESIQKIARSLGLSTVAEMVESRASANYLRDIGVTYAQGDHIGRELDEDGLREWLVTHPDRAGP